MYNFTMFGALAMSLSSFSVVMNALRLNLKHIFIEKKKSTKQSEEDKMQVKINVEGMMCPHCEARVKAAVEAVLGVENVVCSHKDNAVTASVNNEKTVEQIKNAIEAAGYKVIE